MKVWSIDYKDKLVAIAGVEYQPSVPVCFSDIVDNIDAPKKKIYRGIKEVWELIKEDHTFLAAICTDKYRNSESLLKKLGFDEVPAYRGEENMRVFLWHKQFQ